MPNSIVNIDKCRACDGDDLWLYLDLGTQPLANNFQSTPTEQPKYPLQLMVCPRCYHSQLSVVVDPEILYSHYLYVSGTSNTLKEYCDYFAEIVDGMCLSRGTVLDIACNDGTQLDSFAKRGWKTYGVDPAANVTPTAIEKGHKVITDFWGYETAEQIWEMNGENPIDVIVAQNVFAHTHDVLTFLYACDNIMNDDSLLFIQTSQAGMILNGEYDTAYHEHLSFFNVSSMRTLVQRANLHLDAVFHTGIHGTSYVFVISRNGHKFPNHDVDAEFRAELQSGLYDMNTYGQFGDKARRNIGDLQVQLTAHRNRGYRIIGYGAAAKGMTVLNFGRISTNLIHYIIDDSPLKQEKYTPGGNIPIKSSKALLEEDDTPILFVPLAWNFATEIRERIKKLRNNPKDLFLTYFPKVVVNG